MELTLSQKLHEVFLQPEEDRRCDFLLDGYRCQINDKMVVQFTEKRHKIIDLKEVTAALRPHWDKYLEILDKYRDVIDI